MNRRDFFKKILWTPLITPALLPSSAPKGSSQLYVIADSPQLFLPLLLRNPCSLQRISVKTFSFSAYHPKHKEIKRSLQRDGWRPAGRSSQPGISLSFHPLSAPSSPSFTMIKNGRIWDVRSRHLLSLWKEMKSHHPSSILTILTFHKKETSLKPGSFISVSIEGKMKKRISLARDIISSFRTESGQVTLLVKSGKAWVSSSSCRHKICCSIPPVSLSGEKIICAPNQFLLEVLGSSSVDTSIG